jgi:hypothetical protein
VIVYHIKLYLRHVKPSPIVGKYGQALKFVPENLLSAEMLRAANEVNMLMRKGKSGTVYLGVGSGTGDGFRTLHACVYPCCSRALSV